MNARPLTDKKKKAEELKKKKTRTKITSNNTL